MEQVLYAARGVLSGTSWAARLAGWVRRMAKGPAAGDAPLRMEARLHLGPKKSLVLVDCCGKKVLLAMSGDAIVPVLELAKTQRTSARTAARGATR